MLYGTIIGDIVGSPYKHSRGKKTKDFELFSRRSRFTSITAATTAVAEALLKAGRDASQKCISRCVMEALRDWCSRYPDAGYSSKFRKWLDSIKPRPYFSSDNGSAVRAAPAGWLYDTLEQTRAAAAATAMPTHDHPDGIKGAQAVACAVYLARTGKGKDCIRSYITENFGYDLDRTCSSIRPDYQFDVSCAGSVPEAITAFLDSTSFTDAIRSAVSLGGDTGTMAAIAGSIAGAFYGVPCSLVPEAKKKLPYDITHMLSCFARNVIKIRPDNTMPPELLGNEAIAEAAWEYTDSPGDFSLLVNVLEAIRFQAMRGKSLLVPEADASAQADMIPNDASINDILNPVQPPICRPSTVTDPLGKLWHPAFTAPCAADSWDGPPLRPVPITDLLKLIQNSQTAAGLVINLGKENFCLERDYVGSIYNADASCKWDIPGCMPDDRLKSSGETFGSSGEVFEGNEAITEEIVRFRQTNEHSVASIIWALCTQMQLHRHIILPINADMVPEGLLPEASESAEAMDEGIRQYLLPVEMKRGSQTFSAIPIFTNEAQMSRRLIPPHTSCPMERFFRTALRWEGSIYITIDPWNDSGPFVMTRKMLAHLMECYDACCKTPEGEAPGRMPAVRAVRGDISLAGGTEAVVCDSDNDLSPFSTEVSRALHSAAGHELESACAAFGGCETGKAKATGAFSLPYKHVIHTASPEWNGGEYRETAFLEHCYSNALNLAFRLGIRTIAFPPLSAEKGFTAEDAARIAAGAVKKYLSLSGNPGKFDLIEWVIKDKKTFDCFSREIESVFAPGEEGKC